MSKFKFGAELSLWRFIAESWNMQRGLIKDLNKAAEMIDMLSGHQWNSFNIFTGEILWVSSLSYHRVGFPSRLWAQKHSSRLSTRGLILWIGICVRLSNRVYFLMFVKTYSLHFWQGESSLSEKYPWPHSLQVCPRRET